MQVRRTCQHAPMRTTGLLTAVAVLAAVAAVVVLVGWRRHRPMSLMSLGVALTASAVTGTALLAVVIVAWRDLRVRADLLVHHAYLALAVTVPSVAAASLVVGLRRGSSRAARVVGVALLLPAALGAYATHVEPYRLRVDTHELVVAERRWGDDPVRVAVLADLQANHIGAHERRAVDEVLALDPDVIILPGDLFQGRTYQLRERRDDFRRELSRLQAPGGVYFVRGDVDQGRVDRTRSLLDGLDHITVLHDEVEETEVGDRTLRIGGTRLDYDSRAADEVRAELLDTPDDGPFTVLVSHRPDTVLELPPDSRVDLTVAGHTHGGQVVVPVLGPLIANTGIPRDVARGGLHEVDGNTLYVGPGVGMARGEAPQVRFLSRPAVAAITLRDP
jgi:predicted MPP superfamily phosphohydrolase